MPLTPTPPQSISSRRIFVLTRGGPYDTTQVLASLAFFTGIQGGDLAEGAAIALFLFPLLLAAAIVFLRIARRSEARRL